jgi:hypothetical protein
VNQVPHKIADEEGHRLCLEKSCNHHVSFLSGSFGKCMAKVEGQECPISMFHEPGILVVSGTVEEIEHVGIFRRL